MTKRTVYPTLAEAEAAATAANRAADERTAYGTEPVQGGYAVAVLEKVESGWSLREEEEGAIEDSEREVESVEAQACTKASDSLPCPQCGSTAAARSPSGRVAAVSGLDGGGFKLAPALARRMVRSFILEGEL